MLKIALLSGAYKNAGDFLIVHRSEKLLKHIYPNCIITKYDRNKSLDPDLDAINRQDLIVLAGGPAYSPSIYPSSIPLVDNLDNLKPKIFALGLGWYGKNTASNTVYNYKFSDNTRKLMNRIQSDGFSFGCRDIYSLRVLRNNGYKNTLMTGCPAWYNLEYLDKTTLTQNVSPNSIKNICVSDPASISNFQLAIKLVSYLKSEFPNAEIQFIFHRGYNKDTYTRSETAKEQLNLKKKLEALGIPCQNISYGVDGFAVYDVCDLHIGFRVHAHIYNLSIRHPSVLIEEDGRGGGVNEALGLSHIPAYESRWFFNNKYIQYGLDKTINKFDSLTNSEQTIKNVDNYLSFLFSTDGMQISDAFLKMRKYYDVMNRHIHQMDILQ